MWFLTKVWKSYALLLATSFVCLGHPGMQCLLVLAWILYIALVWNDAHRIGLSFSTVLRLTVMSQLPGIALTILSVYSEIYDTLGAGPNGLMEIWYHPFIPILERVPPRTFGIWSDMYLAVCLVPVVIVLLCGLCFALGRRWRQNARHV